MVAQRVTGSGSWPLFYRKSISLRVGLQDGEVGQILVVWVLRAEDILVPYAELENLVHLHGLQHVRHGGSCDN